MRPMSNSSRLRKKEEKVYVKDLLLAGKGKAENKAKKERKTGKRFPHGDSFGHPYRKGIEKVGPQTI